MFIAIIYFTKKKCARKSNKYEKFNRRGIRVIRLILRLYKGKVCNH